MQKEYFHSVILKEDRCIGCTSCLKVCPTEAIRIIDGKARIIDERCIDCGECIRICPNHAKSAVTDNLNVLDKYKYTIAIPTMSMYGQFQPNISINQILNSIKAMGFDEVYDTTVGAKIISGLIFGYLLHKKTRERPLINSSCPAILRLIQIRFPDLLPNVVDIETPMEITARIVKTEAAKKTGLDINEIGVIFFTPCTARATSIKNPLGIKDSYIDAVISIKDIYGEVLKNLSVNPSYSVNVENTKETLEWISAGGQAKSLKIEKYLAVDGIHEVIKVLEDLELGKLDGVDFLELMACRGSCVGGPLVIENSFIARAKIGNHAKSLDHLSYTDEEIEQYIKMYEDGFIRLTETIEPRLVMSLDKDILKSIKKMELIREILKNLPGIDCGVCGAPTCRAFAEDIVKGDNNHSLCIVKTLENFKNKNSRKQGGDKIES